MMRKSFSILSLFVSITIFLACNNQKENAAQENLKPSELINNPNTANTDAVAGANEADIAKIQFEKTEYDFGKVKEGEMVKYEFKFANTGDRPLIIKSARASCGCTVPQWPKDPIAPGDSGVIKVEFDSQRRNGNQNKSITITANTEPNTTLLRLKGNVIGILPTNGPLR